MQDGKALQACTSHDLGQHFAKPFNIQFQGRDGQMATAYTTSWGFSTRSVGGLIMAHSDDDGLRVPPKLAQYHVAIIPVLRDEAATAAIFEYCEKLAKQLKAKGIKVFLDKSDRRTPDKMWDAVKKGVPLRVEIGQREMDEGTLTHVRRDIGKDSKASCSVDEFVGTAQKILDQIQADMFRGAQKFLNDHIFELKDVKEIRAFFADDSKKGFVKIDSKLLEDAELKKVMKEFAVTPRCLPFADEGRKAVIGRSY
jgi:prolyl-tRNA synthetase